MNLCARAQARARVNNNNINHKGHMRQNKRLSEHKKRALILAKRMAKLAIANGKDEVTKGVIKQEYRELVDHIKKS